jgi:hypothetical protein
VEKRIAAGEFTRPERQSKARVATKAELTHTVETVAALLREGRGDKSVTKPALVDTALAVLATVAQEEPATE